MAGQRRSGVRRSKFVAAYGGRGPDSSVGSLLKDSVGVISSHTLVKGPPVREQS